MTLSEFKALTIKQEDEKHFKTRKAGEGQDAQIYKKLVPIKKDQLDEEPRDEFIVIVSSFYRVNVVYTNMRSLGDSFIYQDVLLS